MENTLFQSLDNRLPLTEDAKMIHSSLDMLTSAIIATLIKERLIDYAGQPGQTIEFASIVIANALVEALGNVDTVEMRRFFEK